MASLQELLVEEGLELQRWKLPKTRKPVKQGERTQPHESRALPIYICHDRYSFDVSKQKTEKSASKNGSSVFSSRRVRSVSERSHSKSWVPEGSRTHEPAAPIDEVATRAVISILSGYIGRYVKDVNFRETLREKCKSCLVRKKKEPDHNGILVNVELGIESVEKLVEDQGTIRKELRTKTLRNCIRLLSIVDSLNSKNSKNGSTCGTPNSHIYACAQLYLAVVYKLAKNHRTSARHLLQVFCDSPFLARTNLLPDLWEHFFLPHLLHLKIWYTKELETLSNLDNAKKEKIMKALSKVYNDQMDKGTTDFALYYKDWLKSGVKAPPIPTVPLPSKPSYRSSRRRSSDSYTSQSMNKNLYQHVFGSTLERSSMDLFDPNGASVDTCDLEDVKLCTDEDNCRFVNKGDGTDRGSSSQNLKDSRPELFPETQKSNYFRFFDCRSLPAECLVDGIHTSRNGSVRKEGSTHSSELSRAIFTVCSSDILSECEIAIRIISKAWLDSHGDLAVEAALSEASVIEGMLEVLFASDDDEILEFLISILAEFGGRNKVIRQIILNSDPQLEIFMRLLRSTSLFLKGAVLLYLLQPKAKQMISFEWVPLILRVLEFGDQLQILFTVRCSPQLAAIYLLDQLLTGFDEDRNLENARHVVSLGGMNLLARGIETGDTHDRSNAALLMTCCIRADGSCRNYIAENLNKASLLELIVLESSTNSYSYSCAFALLTELLCLRRRTQMIEFLWGLKEGWSAMPTMNIFLAYLQRAPPEEYPLVAAILLQIDLLGDSMKSSVYREEAVEAMITSLDCKICNDEVQEQSARALLMLGGRFSYTGEAWAERWLLQLAGFHENSWDSFRCKEIVIDGFIHSNEEEEATEDWQRKAATVLFKSGNKRLLAALSNSIANGIPSLARASIITLTWMTSFLHSIEDEDLHSMTCSIIMPQLLESLDFDKDPEERVLASYALLNLMKSSVSAVCLTLDQNFRLVSQQNAFQCSHHGIKSCLAIYRISPW
ncbi:putative E3 ubiquitin-protein ligase LIN isoform X2 [Juglans microcarpa x Juglans regia]|uniref:putative E3 ubiquitin-protein ligase LIN isoform X2 n=1 Tax=Juglans microcarpa x Juglans regia TaxID=2249226 RepID=UPI001B7EA0A1|nr:putative E3 ubiquitin-protein ligase LIN isoform X2 [Juglans microcarpa x Juglans regia]